MFKNMKQKKKRKRKEREKEEMKQKTSLQIPWTLKQNKKRLKTVF